MTLNMCVYCVCATLSKIHLDNGHHDIPIETSSEPNVIRQFETISIFHYHYEFITFLIYWCFLQRCYPQIIKFHKIFHYKL